MRTIDVQHHLHALGWNNVKPDGVNGPITKTAVTDFQRGYNLGAPLAVDGVAGPATAAALRNSVARLRAGQGTASAHFSFSEFACKCGGRYSSCGRIRVHRALLRGLESYRARLGHGVRIVSGYRCVAHNRAVGGASRSQHLYGSAADIEAVRHWTVLAGLRVFSGLGKNSWNNLCRHVDVRHLSGHNGTGGTPDRPTVWNY